MSKSKAKPRRIVTCRELSEYYGNRQFNVAVVRPCGRDNAVSVIGHHAAAHAFIKRAKVLKPNEFLIVIGPECEGGEMRVLLYYGDARAQDRLAGRTVDPSAPYHLVTAYETTCEGGMFFCSAVGYALMELAGLLPMSGDTLPPHYVETPLESF